MVRVKERRSKMFDFERRGAKSYSRDLLIRRQVKSLINRARHLAVERDWMKEAGIVPGEVTDIFAQMYVGNIIVLEKQPKRISAKEKKRLESDSAALLLGDLNLETEPEFQSKETMARAQSVRLRLLETYA